MTIVKPESDRTEISSGFEPVEPGDYIWQFTGGIGILTSETGWRALKFPVMVTKVVNGDEEALESNGNFTFNVMDGDDRPNKFIDETMGYILGYTDLLDKFIGKYGADMDYADQDFIDNLNIQLTGKLIGIIHWNEKGKYTNMRVGTWYKVDEEADNEPTAEAEAVNENW